MLRSLVVLDWRNSLSVVTQLELWVPIVDLLREGTVRGMLESERRELLSNGRYRHARAPSGALEEQEELIAASACVLEFVEEALRREHQLGRLLLQTTPIVERVHGAFETALELPAGSRGGIMLQESVFDAGSHVLHILAAHGDGGIVRSVQELVARGGEEDLEETEDEREERTERQN